MKVSGLITRIIVGVLMIGILNIGLSGNAEAGPAPTLTGARFVYLAVEGNEYLYPNNRNKVICPTELDGEYVDIMVEFKGYPNQSVTFIRQGGIALKKTINSITPTKNGVRTLYRIKKEDMSGGYIILTLDAKGANGGSASASVEGLRLIP